MVSIAKDNSRKKEQEIDGSRVNAPEKGFEDRDLRPVYIVKRLLRKIGKLDVAKDNRHDEKVTDWAGLLRLFDDCSGFLLADCIRSDDLELDMEVMDV